MSRSQVRSNPAQGLLQAAGYYRLQAFFANTRIEDNAALIPAKQKTDYEAQYASWDAKTRDIRAEMKKVAEPMLTAMYKTKPQNPLPPPTGSH